MRKMLVISGLIDDFYVCAKLAEGHYIGWCTILSTIFKNYSSNINMLTKIGLLSLKMIKNCLYLVHVLQHM